MNVSAAALGCRTAFGRISRRVETSLGLASDEGVYQLVESQEGLKHYTYEFGQPAVMAGVESQEGLKPRQGVYVIHGADNLACRISRRVETCGTMGVGARVDHGGRISRRVETDDETIWRWIFMRLPRRRISRRVETFSSFTHCSSLQTSP